MEQQQDALISAMQDFASGFVGEFNEYAAGVDARQQARDLLLASVDADGRFIASSIFAEKPAHLSKEQWIAISGIRYPYLSPNPDHAGSVNAIKDQPMFYDGDVFEEGLPLNVYNYFFEGSPYDDVLYGSATHWSRLWGHEGDDVIRLRSSGSIGYGGAGDDHISTEGDGNFKIIGGIGHDTVISGSGADYVFLDSMDGTNQPELDGDDYASTGAGNDWVDGGDGNDTINAGDGNNLVFGGRGRDTIIVGDGDNQIFADGYSILTENSTLNGDTITYSWDVQGYIHANTELAKDQYNDLIITGNGNNRIVAGAGDDTVIAGDGNDIIHGDVRPLASYVNAGNVEFGAGVPLSYHGNDTIYAGGGDDIVYGGGGDDFIDGGDGNDVLFGDDPDIPEAAGDDVIYGGAGDDQIDGGAGDDMLYGEDGNDIIWGRDGDDYIDGGKGDDLLDGGSGDDFIRGGSGNDKLFGRDGNDVLYGDEGNDELYGGDGDDILDGGTGDDLLVAGKGNDTLRGGDGNDWLDALTDSASTDVNYLYGDAGNDVLLGGAGKDYLFGGSGNDHIQGGANDDYLDGGDGDDVLLGQSGNNTLIGGRGNDKLFGGSGNNTYLFTAGDGYDYIRDTSGSNKIVLQGESQQSVKVFQNAHTTFITYGHGDTIVMGNQSFSRISSIELGAGQLLDIAQLRDTLANQQLQIAAAISSPSFVNGFFRIPDGSENEPQQITRWFAGQLISISSLTEYVDFNNPATWLEAGAVSMHGPVRYFKNEAGTILAPVVDSVGNTHIPAGAVSEHILWPDGSRSNYDVNFANEINSIRTPSPDEEFIVPDGSDGDASGYNSENKVIHGTEHADTLTAGQLSSVLHGGDGNDVLNGQGGDDILIGGTGDDELRGHAGDDILLGGSGNDRLYGGAGDDVLDGGEGNDYLSGGSGSDIYRFSPGWGQDIINNLDTSTDKTDAIQFTESIHPSEIMVSRSGDHLVLSRLNTTDSITVQSYFSNDGDSAFKLEEIRFASGVVWDISTVKAMALNGTDGDDILQGYATNDELRGGAGNDVLYGKDGDDVLHGEAGDDRLYGGAGDDILIGGSGNDYLEGGAGSDVYWFERGWGQDTILNYDNGNDKVDAIVFAEGISAEDILLSRDGDHLILALRDSSDQITLQSYFFDDDHCIDEIRFADGTVWSIADVKLAVIQGTPDHDVIYGYETNDVIFGGDGNDTLFGADGDDELHGEDGDDYLDGGNGDDQLFGGEGNDDLRGGAGNDQLYGGPGDDRLSGGHGDDLLVGGTGNDYLEGGAGSDVYWFDRGWGQDRIYNFDSSNDKTDAIEFAPGILPTEIQLSRIGTNLLLTLAGSNDSITVERYFQDDGFSSFRLEEIRFADGTVWHIEQVKELVLQGTDGDDTLYGYASDDVLHGGAGNDTLYGGAGDDVLHGEAGDDRLYGGNGNDILYGGDGDDQLIGEAGDDQLYGGAGNDYLSGGAGNDIYWFDRGWGQDIISNWDNGSDKTDAIVFAEGITPDEIRITRSNTDLLLTLVGSTDRITVRSYFDNDGASAYKLEEIRFADGTVWDIAQVKALAIQGTEGNDTLYGYATDDVLHGGAGNDTLYGGAGDDELHGDDGEDRLYGGIGQDVLYGGDGNDQLYGEAGDDRLYGGAGDDRLFGGDGDDILDGGAGDDWLEGGFGVDTYLFYQGSGADTVRDNLGASIFRFVDTDSQHIIVRRKANEIRVGDDEVRYVLTDDALLTNTLTGDTVTIKYFFGNYGSGRNFITDSEFHFADGISWLGEELNSRALLGTDGDDLIFSTRHGGTIMAGAGNDKVVGDSGNDLIFGGDGDDYIYAISGNNELYGEDGNDHIIGTGLLDGGAGDDVLEGRGSDTLRGGDGNDTLIAYSDAWTRNSNVLEGGKGNDTIYGSFGDDTYIFNQGDGHDLIIERREGEAYSNVEASFDTLQFGEGITVDDLTFIRQGRDLLILFTHETDSITVQNWFAGSEHYQLNLLTFTDGSELTAAEVEARIVTMGTDAADTLFGGVDKDDVIFGEGGDDYIDGRGGNNRLYGGDGNDTLVSGTGNDLLVGGAGDDKYVFKPGCGQNIIDNQGGGFDGIFFINGIDASRLSFSRDGDDLLVLIDQDEAQSVRVLNYFLGGDAAISYVQPAGSSMLTAEQIAAAIAADSEEPEEDEDELPTDPEEPTDPELPEEPENPDPDGSFTPGLGGNDQLTGTDGNDVLLGGAGDDVLSGLAGNDRLYGGTGNDTYIYHSGRDVINEQGGNDTLIFSNSITFNQVASGLMKSGNDLVLRVNGSMDNSVTLSNFFLGGGYLVERIEFETGGAITAAQIFGAFGLPVPTGNAPARNIIHGTAGDDTLTGTDGDDVLLGSHGNDILRGGKGNDLLIGGRGNDTYIVAAGDGQTTIDNTGGGDDVLRFEGISFNQVASGLMKSGHDLILNIGGSSDKVTIKNWFLGGDHVIPVIQFASGGQISANQIFGAFGLTNPNPLRSLDYNDLPDERAFGTVFVGTAASETIIGSSGDDFIEGGDGDDVIRGGAGNDYLLGGRGNDTYLFGAADGHNIINNYDPAADRTDVLRFDTGIVPADVVIEREGDHLILRPSADSSITVLNYYAENGQSAYRLDEIQFADGTSWQYHDVQQLQSAHTMMNATLDRQAMQLIDALNSFDSSTEDEASGDFMAARLQTEELVY